MGLPSNSSVDPLAPAGGGTLAPAGGRASLLGNRGFLTSAVSVLSFIALIAIVVATAPGGSKVAKAFFSRDGFRESAGPVWRGFETNIKLMVVAEILVLVAGLAIAVARSIPGPAFLPVRLVAIGYVDIFRGIPLVLVIFMVGLGVPGMQIGYLSHRSLFTYGVIALVLVYSAYVAEVYRAGIESVHSSQVAAARSLSLNQWQTMRFVVLPQAVRRVIPPLLNDFIGLQKDTALVGLLGLVDSARAAQDYSTETFNFTGYTMAALLFVLVTIPLARFTDLLIDRDRRRMRAAGG